jgi:hypothetical protein
MTFDTPRCEICGEPARGTLETVSAVAILLFDEEGRAEYLGETQIGWNRQVTQRDVQGRVALVCSNDHVWYSRVQERCECELPGYFNSGVPGILAHLEEDGNLAPDAAVERCDLCERYPTDEAAREHLREMRHDTPPS